MQFVFLCPRLGKTYVHDDFCIVDNRGVVIDEAGKRFFDARVRLTSPCPLCGELHEYHASELACPFGDPASNPHTNEKPT